MHIEWKQLESILTKIDLYEFTSHSLQYTVHNLNLSQAGEYKCLYYIDTADYNSYINPSVTKSDVINITAISK